MEKEIVRDDKGRFLKGFSGNPEGRSVDNETVTGILCEYLNSKKTIRSKRKRKEVLIEKLYEKAESGDIQAMKLILSYSDGLPIARVQNEITENINNNMQWINIRTKILQVINTYPKLRKELSEVLDDD